MRHLPALIATAVGLAILTACADEVGVTAPTDGAHLALNNGKGPNEGMRLFDHETFGGNGRTCRTCHMPGNGTLTVDAVRERLAEDPNDPLFLDDGLDDGVAGTSRIATHATIRIALELPPNVTLANNPSQRSRTARTSSRF